MNYILPMNTRIREPRLILFSSILYYSNFLIFQNYENNLIKIGLQYHKAATGRIGK